MLLISTACRTRCYVSPIATATATPRPSATTARSRSDPPADDGAGLSYDDTRRRSRHRSASSSPPRCSAWRRADLDLWRRDPRLVDARHRHHASSPPASLFAGGCSARCCRSCRWWRARARRAAAHRRHPAWRWRSAPRAFGLGAGAPGVLLGGAGCCSRLFRVPFRRCGAGLQAAILHEQQHPHPRDLRAWFCRPVVTAWSSASAWCFVLTRGLVPAGAAADRGEPALAGAGWAEPQCCSPPRAGRGTGCFQRDHRGSTRSASPHCGHRRSPPYRVVDPRRVSQSMPRASSPSRTPAARRRLPRAPRCLQAHSRRSKPDYRLFSLPRGRVLGARWRPGAGDLAVVRRRLLADPRRRADPHGGFGGTITAMLYKIVPFLAWLHLTQAGLKAPNMKKLPPDTPIRRQHACARNLATLCVAVFVPVLARSPASCWRSSSVGSSPTCLRVVRPPRCSENVGRASRKPRQRLIPVFLRRANFV